MDIPKFETICDLFEKKPNAWEKARPYLHFALLLAPGIALGGFGTFEKALTALNDGTTLAGAMELLENLLFHPKGRFRKRPDFESPYDLPRLANTMVIFAAWFDMLEEETPGFWKNLDLDEYGWKWLREECRAEHQQVTELVGGDGRNILLSDGQEMLALKQLYILLKEQTRKLAQGLAATENQQADWDAYPEQAVKKYCRYCEILKKYTPYRDWVGQQYLEKILLILQDQKSPKAPTPGKLRLPPTSVLPVAFFRGRAVELDRIRAAFKSSKIVILSGLGGMGKTELAIAYSKELPDTNEAYFFPFRGDFKESIAQALSEGMPEYANRNLTTAEAFPIVWKLLMECAPEDLLILDNVDVSAQSLNAICRELGKLSMRCLVTTRYEAPGAIEVGTLPEDELLKIFDDYNTSASTEERLALIRAVDQHTLTVNLVAQTLRSGRVEAQAILDGLKNQNFDDIPLPEVEAHYPGAEQQKKIYGHLQTVFRVTNMSDPAKAALSCAVLLPHGGMDVKAFQAAMDKDAADLLFSLAQNGWLNWHGKLISIHPVIRLVCRNELNPTDESCSTFLDQLLDQHDPNRYDQIHYCQLAELFNIASDTLEDGKGQWSLRSGFFWSKLGEYHQALTSSQKALAICKKVLPSDHPDLATSYSNVGTIYDQLGDHNMALEYLLQALDIREKVLPSDHTDLAASYNNVGTTYNHLGNYNKALEYLLQALVIWEKILPSDHPDLATSYNNVGSIYGQLGSHNKELDYQLQALAIQEKVLSSDHPDLALSYNNVGYTYGQLGDHKEELEYLLKALDIREKVLPDNHPDMAQSYNNVGTTYIHLGDYKKALEYFLKAMAISEKILASDHPDLALSYNNVGYTYGQLGDHNKELEYLLKALDIREKVLPKDHPNLALSYNNVGSAYGQLGDHNKELNYQLRALDIREKILPNDHPDLAQSYNNVGTTYVHLGDHEKAFEHLLKALVIRENVLPQDHPDIASSCSNIAFILAQMKRFPEAMPYIQRAVTIAEHSLPENHPDLANYRQGKDMLELFAMLQELGIEFDNSFK